MITEEEDEAEIGVSDLVRAAQQISFVKEYECSKRFVPLVSYEVRTNPESKSPGPALPKECPVLFVHGNVFHLVLVPQVEIHDDSEVYQPGQDGKLVVYRRYAQEQGWFLPKKDSDEEEDEDASEDSDG